MVRSLYSIKNILIFCRIIEAYLDKQKIDSHLFLFLTDAKYYPSKKQLHRGEAFTGRLCHPVKIKRPVISGFFDTDIRHAEASKTFKKRNDDKSWNTENQTVSKRIDRLNKT